MASKISIEQKKYVDKDYLKAALLDTNLKDADLDYIKEKYEIEMTETEEIDIFKDDDGTTDENTEVTVE